MTCDNCIHERVCVIKAFPDAFENTQWEKEPCDHFKSKSEWISVEERMPDTTLKKLTICDQDIGSGEVVKETDGGMVPISEIVAVICTRCVKGEVKRFIDIDQTIDGQWAYCMGVTHWMPLPEAPKMKGGERYDKREAENHK